MVICMATRESPLQATEAELPAPPPPWARSASRSRPPACSSCVPLPPLTPPPPPPLVQIAPLMFNQGAQQYCPVVACQDRSIRVLDGNGVLYDTSTAAPPTCLVYIPESHDPQHRFPNAKELLYGTEAGQYGGGALVRGP